MKPKSKVWKYEIVLVCVIVMIVVLSLGCLQKESEEVVPPTPTIDKEEIAIVPEDFTICQDYIKTIGGKPAISDIGTIEATVISITKTVVCPDETDPFAPEPTECSIEPYPKDLGIVKIDKISNYTPYSKQTTEPTIEQPSEEKSPEEVETIPSYEGHEYPSKPNPLEGKEYEPLQEGQEVQTFFLLTARPAKVRYVSINESEGGRESAQLAEDGTQQTVSQQVEHEKKIFKPIPKDGNYYIFTTKIGNFSGIIKKNLPGLEIGTKFRAEIYYDGSLYVEEYEVIK
jgi:hypothetical protein